MDITHEPGEGPEFLPCYSLIEGAGSLKDDIALLEAPCQHSLRILLVDDDELIRGAVGPMLEILGHQVQSVDSGMKALHHFEDGLEVDLVILDMNMPGINGAETLRRLLIMKPQQTVLMASGCSDHDVHRLLEGYPKVASIQKPFSLREIHRKLAELNLLPMS